MRRYSKWGHWLGVVFLALAVLGLWGCSPRKTDPIRSGWSRSIPVGEASAREAPAIAVNEDVRWLVWSGRADGNTALLLSHVDVQGKVTSPASLPIPLNRPHAPRLFSAADGLCLFFLARETSDRNRLFMQSLNVEGTPVGDPVPISLFEQRLEAYDVAVCQRGFWVFWNVTEGGLWAQALDDHATPQGSAVLLHELGGPPSALVDQAGRLHAVWLAIPTPNRRALMYATFSDGDLTEVPVLNLWETGASIGSIFSPPALALEEDWVYAFISVEYRSGLKQGSSETYVTTFPIDSAAQAQTFLLSLPDRIPEDYTCCTEGLSLAPLPPEGARRPTDTLSPTTIPGQREYALVGVGVKMGSIDGGEIQPALVVFRGGKLVGWSPIAKTNGLSLFPQVCRSPDGWHALWLDMLGYGEYRAYYASTAPAERSSLDRLVPADVLHMVLITLSGIVSGIAFVPLFLMAAVPGLLLIVGHYIFGGLGNLDTWRMKTLLVVGLLPYAFLKVLLTAGVMPQVPFSQWMASELSQTLTVGLPFAFLGVDALVLLVYLWRAQEPGLLPAWALFVGMDIALTVTVLGPLFGGA